MESERISVARDGGIAHVELIREDRLNAMDGEMFGAIGEAFRSLGSDSAVRAILLSGRGRHFTAGFHNHQRYIQSDITIRAVYRNPLALMRQRLYVSGQFRSCLGGSWPSSRVF